MNSREIDASEIADLLGELQAQSHRVAHAHLQRRGVKAGLAAKRRCVNRLFKLLFGRNATEEEHQRAATDAIGFYG